MRVSIIAAVSENGVIGWEGGVPWRLRDDLKWFKTVTMGHHLIFGRTTFEVVGKPLPGREIIVLSRNPAYTQPHCLVANSLQAALALAANRGEGEVFVGGGSQVYRPALPIAGRMYLTRVHARVAGDTFFPSFDASGWTVTEEWGVEASARNEYPFTVQILERK